MLLTHNQKIKFIVPLFILIFLIFLPFIFNHSYLKHVMIMILLYAILAEAWNILGGFTGQISLGNTIFFGVGAYTSSILFINFKINPWIGLLLGGVLAVIIGIIIGLPVFRLRRQYFVIATLVAGEIIRVISQSWDFLHGAVGLDLPIMKDSLKNMTFLYNKDGFYYITLSILIILIILVYFLLKSKLGYYFKMIKEEEDVARSIGINTRAYKLVAISMTAFFTAIAGSVFAQYLLYIDPTMVFSSDLSIKILLIVALGGVGTIWGPVLGALILIPLIEGSRVFFGGGKQGVDLMVYAILVIVIALFRPDGLITFFQKKIKNQYIN